MRHALTVLFLLLAGPVEAAPLPEGAYDRGVSPEEAQRLTRLLMRSNPEDREKTMRRFRERRENVERLRAELYAASPDMALIEQLRLREMELQRETLAEANLRSERFLRTLGPEDRLKFLRMEFGLPPLIVIPDKRAPAIGH